MTDYTQHPPSHLIKAALNCNYEALCRLYVYLRVQKPRSAYERRYALKAANLLNNRSIAPSVALWVTFGGVNFNTMLMECHKAFGARTK